MTRILIISTCLQCPHHDDFRCYHNAINPNKNLIDNHPDIPDWCPLEVADE